MAPAHPPRLELTPDMVEEPIRAELFGVERLEQHAESLAAAQPVLKGTVRGRPLLPRVQDNGRVLRETYRAVAKAIREERSIVPAAEWLVDNFHIVDEQLREIRDDLPPGFYRELPKLADGPFAGYPRVYGIAWAFVAHTDSRFDPDLLRRFVLAYQRIQPLTIGELWAVAITLRVVLVENLRRLAESIVRGRTARETADALADDLLGLSGDDTRPATLALQKLEEAPLGTAFAVQLVQRLRDQDPAVTPALVWLDRRLAAQGTTSDEIARVEHQRQAAMNVTVRNVIMSMGLMSALEWTEFFESISLVDRVLQADVNYLAMDFATRDSYRHAIEELARGSGRRGARSTMAAGTILGSICWERDGAGWKRSSAAAPRCPAGSSAPISRGQRSDTSGRSACSPWPSSPCLFSWRGPPACDPACSSCSASSPSYRRRIWPSCS